MLSGSSHEVRSGSASAHGSSGLAISRLGHLFHRPYVALAGSLLALSHQTAGGRHQHGLLSSCWAGQAPSSTGVLQHASRLASHATASTSAIVTPGPIKRTRAQPKLNKKGLIYKKSGLDPKLVDKQPVCLSGKVIELDSSSMNWRRLTLELDEQTWQQHWEAICCSVPASAGFYGFTKANRVKVKGMKLGALQQGQRVQIEGRWEVSPQYGVSVQVENAQELPASSDEDWVELIAGMVKGLGSGPAAEFVKRFGADGLKELLDSSDAVQRIVRAKVKTIGKSRAAAIKEAWDSRRVLTGGLSFLNTLDLPPRVSSALLAKHGEHAERALRQDVWQAMLEVPGASYGLVQELAQKLSGGNVPPLSPSQAAFALHAALLKNATSNGQTYTRWGLLQTRAARIMEEGAKYAASSAPKALASATSINSSTHGGNMAGAESEVLDEGWIEGMDGEAEASMAGASVQLSVQQALWQGMDQLLGTHKVVVTHTASAKASSTRLPLASAEAAGTAPPIAAAVKYALLAQDWAYGARVYHHLLREAEQLVTDKLASLARASAAAFPHLLHPSGSAATASQIAAAAAAGAVGSRRACALDPTKVMAAAPKDMTDWLVQYTAQLQSEKGLQLTEEQQAVVVIGSKSPLMVLTGAAGCGKTYATEALVKYWRTVADKKVVLCAPTGRAAQRLQALAGESNALRASTIHRLLGYKARNRRSVIEDTQLEAQAQEAALRKAAAAAASSTGPSQQQVAGTAIAADDWDALVAASKDAPVLKAGSAGVDNQHSALTSPTDFVHNADNPLDADVVLVDEVSMVDLQLLAALLRALRPGTQLVLVGDAHQLPPVGPGQPLLDLLGLAEHADQMQQLQAHRPAPTQALSVPQVTSEGGPGQHAAIGAPAALTADAFTPADGNLSGSVGNGSKNSGSSASAGGKDNWLVPVMELSRVLRQVGGHSSAIVTAAHRIKAGRVPIGPDQEPGLVQLEGGVPQLRQILFSAGLPDRTLAPREALAAVVNAVTCQVDDAGEAVHISVGSTAEVSQTVEHLVRLLAQSGMHVAKDVQVISPTKTQYEASVRPLNGVLRTAMNTPPPDWSSISQRPGLAGVHRFWPNDRVVQIVNNYDIDVYNGDQGKVVVSDANEVTVVFPPRAGQRYPHTVKYTGAERHQLQLAWATTVHKAQGGEFPVVILALHDLASLGGGFSASSGGFSSGSGLLNRLLLYTAVTRAKQLLFVVSERDVLRRAVVQEAAPRQCTLLERLQQELLGEEPLQQAAGPPIGTGSVSSRSYSPRRGSASVGGLQGHSLQSPTMRSRRRTSTQSTTTAAAPATMDARQQSHVHEGPSPQAPTLGLAVTPGHATANAPMALASAPAAVPAASLAAVSEVSTPSRVLLRKRSAKPAGHGQAAAATATVTDASPAGKALGGHHQQDGQEQGHSHTTRSLDDAVEPLSETAVASSSSAADTAGDCANTPQPSQPALPSSLSLHNSPYDSSPSSPATSEPMHFSEHDVMSDTVEVAYVPPRRKPSRSAWQSVGNQYTHARKSSVSARWRR